MCVVRRSFLVPVNSRSARRALACCSAELFGKSKRAYGGGIFAGLNFILSGFTESADKKQIGGSIRKHGGTVLLDIPQPPVSGRRKSLSPEVGHHRYWFRAI